MKLNTRNQNITILTSNMGNLSEFHWSILGLLISTTVTVRSGHFEAIREQVGPPTYPAPIQQIFLILMFKQLKAKY